MIMIWNKVKIGYFFRKLLVIRRKTWPVMSLPKKNVYFVKKLKLLQEKNTSLRNIQNNYIFFNMGILLYLSILHGFLFYRRIVTKIVSFQLNIIMVNWLWGISVASTWPRLARKLFSKRGRTLPRKMSFLFWRTPFLRLHSLPHLTPDTSLSNKVSQATQITVIIKFKYTRVGYTLCAYLLTNPFFAL